MIQGDTLFVVVKRECPNIHHFSLKMVEMTRKKTTPRRSSEALVVCIENVFSDYSHSIVADGFGDMS